MRATLDTRRRAHDLELQSPIVLIDALTANPGSPGGALVTVDGRLAGMIGKIIESDSTHTRLNYAIPNDVLAAFVEGRPTTADVATSEPTSADGGPVDLGIRIFNLSGPRAPAYVDRVVSGSPADRAGVQRDDLVLSINGKWVRTVTAYEQQVDKLRSGREVRVTIKRGDKVKEITIPTGGEGAR